MIRYALLAEEAAAVLGDEDVVLDADAAEVLILFDFVEAEELLAVAALAPVVDEGRDEVDARLVGDDEAFLQAAPHAQGVGTELVENGARLLVEAHVDLVEILHVVHVHAHHVAQSVRQEHGVGAGAHSLLGVAFHQAELLQPVGHQAAYGEVTVHVLHAGLGNVQNQVVAVLDNRIDVELALRVLAADGHRAGIVGTVVIDGLGTAVAQGQTSGLQRAQRRSTVHDLTVLREDGGEAHLSTIAVGDAVHLSGNVFLGDAGLDQTHGRRVHHVADFGGALQFLNFLLRLGRAHFHHGHDEFHRGSLLLLRGVQAQQVHDLNLDVVPVGRQEVDGAAFRASLVADGLQLCHRSRLRHTHLGSHVGHALHRAVPNDVLDVDVVADEAFTVVVDVDDAHQSVALLSEVIQERRVLTERVVGVVGVVVGRLVVAEEHHYALADELLELIAALYVSFFAKHIDVAFGLFGHKGNKL